MSYESRTTSSTSYVTLSKAKWNDLLAYSGWTSYGEDLEIGRITLFGSAGYSIISYGHLTTLRYGGAIK